MVFEFISITLKSSKEIFSSCLLYLNLSLLSAALDIMIQDRLNHRHRKVLSCKTPYEVFFSEMSRKLAS